MNGDGRDDAVSILGRVANVGSTPARTLSTDSEGGKFRDHVADGLSHCGIQASCVLADMDADGRRDVLSYTIRSPEVWIAKSHIR